jgi:4-hydroxybenzoate polyprenyltransferase
MNRLASSRGERIAAIIVSILTLIGAIASSLWLRSWLPIIVYVISIAVPVTFSLFRSRRPSKVKVLKTKDDPNEMARWVP